MKRSALLLSALLLLLYTACEVDDGNETDAGDTGDAGQFDQALLAQYRAAIPSQAQLAATAVPSTSNKGLGDPALYPPLSQGIATGINGAIIGMVEILETIVALTPTLYNSETLEFLWGPYPYEDGYGTIALYVRDMGTAEDFRYHYAFLRGTGNDVATMTPVIWGASTPDPDEARHGKGITLWDFEANHDFEEARNPSFESLDLDRGRFVAVYGVIEEGEAETAFAIAVFRDFVPADQPTLDPADLDYLYGHVTSGEDTLDFLSWDGHFDIDSEPSRDDAEDVSMNLAFIDTIGGRAEAFAEGGDMEESQYATSIECWDEDVLETYLLLQIWSGNAVTTTFEQGTEANCGTIFSNSLDELDIPAVGDLDSELLDALDDLASNGVPEE